jgi:Zn-dependent protease
MASNNNNNNNNNNSNGVWRAAISGPSFSVGTWFGVPIRVHYSYFVIVVLSVLTSLRYFSLKVSLYEFIVMGPILFLTVIIHEFGHILVSKQLGGKPIEIIMWPLGGVAVSTIPDPATALSMLLVAAGGPATHLFQILFWVAIAFFFKIFADYEGWSLDHFAIKDGNMGDWLRGIALGALYLNAGLLIFNLFVPAYPLDGGQIFASALLMCGCSAESAARITSTMGMAISALLILFGVASLVFSHNPFAILNILVGLFIFHSSYQLYQLVKSGNVNDHPLFATALEQKRQQAQEPQISEPTIYSNDV